MARTAHPRLRGEHYPCAASAEVDSGSSPLTRGARCRAAFHVGVERLIPAYAGSTNSPVASGGGVAAHPRLRGEHFRFGSLTGRGGGSSPLTRGAQNTRPNAQTMMWLIPAYAGSTAIRIGSISTARAHPRLRGEHRLSAFGLSSCRGSSPLTRGALNNLNLLRKQAGLIPAYAGSTPLARDMSRSRWAHPRLRGEHHPADHVTQSSVGSSPLTRGALSGLSRHCFEVGLIPAYAGSTVGVL